MGWGRVTRAYGRGVSSTVAALLLLSCSSDGPDAELLVDYSVALSAESFPTDPVECGDAFDGWAEMALEASIAASKLPDEDVHATLADHQAAYRAAFRDCLKGDQVDVDELSALDGRLGEVVMP